MRPDLVKRMVLDGVSDAESYFNDVLQWGRDGMEGTHKVRRTYNHSVLIDTNASFRHSLASYQLVQRPALSIVLSRFLPVTLARLKLPRAFASV